MNSNLHDRIESIAGAIALGEATDQERCEYREHIAACRECLRDLGGEHEIERVASTVTQACESEVWEPDLGDVVLQKNRRRARVLRVGFSFFGVVLAASLGVHVLLVNGIAHLAPTMADPLVINAGTTRIVLEDRAAVPPKPAAPPPRRLLVMHNVVQIARAPMVPIVSPVPVTPKAPVTAAAKAAPPQQISSVTVHADTDPAPHAVKTQSNVPIWRRGDSAAWRTVATTTTTSVSETAPEMLTHSAESIHVAPSYTREAAPIGGDTAINPQPPMIAYDQGAEGTTVFEVLLDERGIPTKCVITKPAGYPVLDEAVCKAAMQAKYNPKIVNGRAVPGVYKDAFTFRIQDSSIEGVPKQIQ